MRAGNDKLCAGRGLAGSLLPVVLGVAVLGVAVLGVTGMARAADCGDLLIVLDRSGSMASCLVDGKTKESMAKAAIKAIIAKYPTLPMGLAVFPDTLASCGMLCAPGKVVVDVTATGSMDVSTFLDTMPMSCGGTPTGPSMETVRDYAKWASGRKHYVLLITDGQPTCQDGFNDMAMTMPCDGMGYTTNECKYPTKVWDAIKALYDKGTHTFVVGFAGMGSGSGCGAGGMPFNPDTLNKMADLGGEALPGATHFYSATDAMTIVDALDRIIGKVASGTVGGCSSSGGDGGASDGGGSGGGSGADGGGGAGGNGGGGDNGGTPPGQRGSASGCACGVGDDAARGGGSAAAVVLGAALGARRRRRR